MKKFLEEFKTFALKGNVMDMAVGVIIGAAFQAIVSSLVSDLICINQWCYISIWKVYYCSDQLSHHGICTIHDCENNQ